MTARQYTIRSILLIYSAIATSTALIAAGLAPWIDPRYGLLLFLGAFVALLAAAAPAGSWLLCRVELVWDARWDEDGRPWAVLEAERITGQAAEPPELPPTGGETERITP